MNASLKFTLVAALTFTVHSFAAEPRAARSVHLGYSAPEGDLFYNEMVVVQTENGSYFMACGGNTS